MRLAPNGFQTLIQGQARVEFPPLARMSHIGEIEPVKPDIFHSSESDLEELLYAAWSRAPILGTEVQVVLVPLCVNIDDVVQMLILRRLRYMLWLELGFNQSIRLLLNVPFHPFRQFLFGPSWWAIHPYLLCCHTVQSSRSSRVRGVVHKV
jgi:hypothetical protein